MIYHKYKVLTTIFQRQFAKKINLDAGYISRIMQGKVTPPDLSLAKKQVLESIDTLNDEQINAVSAFIKYLTEYKND